MSISGKHGVGRIGSTGSGGLGGQAIHGLTEWSVVEKGDELDATDAEADGVEQTDVGVIGPAINIKGFHKLDKGPFPTLRTGSEIEDLKLFLNKNTPDASWTFTKAIVTNVRSQSQVRDKILYDVDVKNAVDGTYTGPTDSDWT